MKRNIERFPSKQMYPYLSLVERKVAEFYHNIDRRSWLVWVNMTYFHCFFRTIPGVLNIFPQLPSSPKNSRILPQGYQELSGESDENNPLKPNQSAPSIYIMIELCYFSLDQWEIRIHLLSGKCFNIPHDCDPHLDQTKFY